MLDDLFEAAPRSTQTDLRSLLGCFLFSDDDVFKPIGVLSGGERNRYALARMLFRPSNFLLLDEPTNHLDMRAKDVLLESLQKFTGTVVFVSHDRYFIDRLATRVFEVADGKVNIYPGNYEDYLWRKEGGAQQLAEATQATTVTATVSAPQEEDRSDARKRLNPIKLKQMTDRCSEVEAEIEECESTISETETAMNTFVSAEETQRLSELLQTQKQRLSTLLGEWEELSQIIEANA